MKTRIVNLFFVSVFCIIICIPNLHLSPAEKSEEENRMLAKYVPLTYDKKINWNYGADFEKFYNDRFYCRRKLIELNATVQNKSFSVNAYGIALKGKDDWLFLRRDGDEYNFVNYTIFDEKQLKQGLKYLTDIKSWCDANGKSFVFMICPDKNKIYGEYFPDGYKKVRPDTESRAFQFINYVRENSDISIIYPYEELLAEKASGRLLYYKVDSHWSYDGAYIGYKKLIKEIQKKLAVEEVEVIGWEEEKKLKGDLNGDLNKNFFPVDETTVYKTPKINPKYIDVEGKIWGPPYYYITDNKNGKYNVLFYRDSFTSYLKEFFSNSFNRATYYQRYNVKKEDLAYIKDNADVVVLECVERLLPNAVLNTFPKTNSSVSEATK